MTIDQYAWLDKYIAEQHAYWVKLGFPADIISQVADGIERYGDDFFEPTTHPTPIVGSDPEPTAANAAYAQGKKS